MALAATCLPPGVKKSPVGGSSVGRLIPTRTGLRSSAGTSSAARRSEEHPRRDRLIIEPGSAAGDSGLPGVTGAGDRPW